MKMSIPEIRSTASPSKRRHWFILIGIIVLILLCVPVGYWIYFTRAERDLRQAVSEAERLDPGWRFDEMEAAREVVPDNENAALQVLAARKMIPKPIQRLTAFPWQDIIERIEDLSPEIRLDDKREQEIREETAKHPAPLAAARRIAQMPRGRYPVGWAENILTTRMPHIEDVREVAHLLILDAALWTKDREIKGALVSIRAIVNTARSLGDEPALISQRIRSLLGQTGVRSLERALAQGEASGVDLEDLQRLLEDEARQPLQLIAARAQRAMIYQHLEVVRAGKFNRAAVGLTPSPLGSKADDFLDSGKALGSEAAYLRHLTHHVEIAKLPAEQQHDLLSELQPPQVALPKLLEALSYNDQWSPSDAFHQWLALMRCGIAAVAAERYRLAHHRWPEELKTLVPQYLDEVPVDPYDGRPLRFRRLNDGLVIYSLGPDRHDNGGTIFRSPRKDGQGWEGKDIGFRLWDAGQRGR
jgi:hypothetical protein